MVKKDITFVRGDTWTIEFNITDAAGDPVNITNWTGKMQMNRTIDGGSIVILTSANGKVVVSGVAGKVICYLEPADTSSIGFDGNKLVGVYDLELTTPTGSVYTIAQGVVTIIKDVTK